MENVVCEPFELTECELNAVAGGNRFSSLISAAFSAVDVHISADFDVQTNLASQTNLFNISGP
jgi:hypothetical protein